MSNAPPIRTQRVYPTRAREQAAASDGSPRLILGLFENGGQVIDTGLTMLLMTGLILNFGFGSLAILGFLAAFGALGIRAPLQAVKNIAQAWPVLLLPIIAFASVAWSHYPDITTRGAIQLLLTVLAAVVMAGRVTSRQFIAALFVACLLCCLINIAMPISIDTPDGLAIVGIMGSKNQLAFLAGELILTSITIACDSKHMKIIRLGALSGVVIGFGLVGVAKSAGGLVDAVSGCAIFTCLVMTFKMRRSARTFLIVAAVILASPLVIAAPAIQKYADNFIIEVLHKDPTLTGRTYLWDRAAAISAEHPILGLGYNAFWVQGESDAEGLWAYAGITQRSGFNFHNQYIDVLVMLGWLGLAFFATAILYSLLGVGAESLIAPNPAGACLTANVVVILIRTLTESGLVLEFNWFLVIFTAAGLFAWRTVREAKLNPEAVPAPLQLRTRGGVQRDRVSRPTRALRRMGR